MQYCVCHQYNFSNTIVKLVLYSLWYDTWYGLPSVASSSSQVPYVVQSSHMFPGLSPSCYFYFTIRYAHYIDTKRSEVTTRLYNYFFHSCVWIEDRH